MFVVATPIGNLEDMSHRAIRILKEVDLIAAEDTRHTQNLLRHYEIKNGMTSYHDFNKEKKTPDLISRLLNGESLAIVSDAGTPGISDPAFYLVREALKNGISVIPVPGPTAVISALVCSGLPTDRFSFEGFLPAKKGRQKALKRIGGLTGTVVLYESPHRLLRTLNDLKMEVGDCHGVVARELTKKFEEVCRGLLSELIHRFQEKKPKGEFVILINREVSS